MSFRDSHRQLTFQHPKTFAIWEVRIACTPDGISKAVRISPDGGRIATGSGLWRDANPLPKVTFRIDPQHIPTVLGRTESILHQITAFIPESRADRKTQRLADFLR